MKAHCAHFVLLSVEGMYIMEKYAVNSEYESMVAPSVEHELLTRTSNIYENNGLTIVKYQLFQ